MIYGEHEGRRGQNSLVQGTKGYRGPDLDREDFWRRDKKPRDVGDSQLLEDISIASEVSSSPCALKMKNKFACLKFSVNFAEP